MKGKNIDKWHLGTLESLVTERTFKRALGIESAERKEPLRGISETDIREGRGLAILAYIPFLCFIPFLSKEKNQFAYEHAKQGVMLFIVELFILISVLFWKAALFIASLVALVGVIYALQGKIWRIPYISELGDRFDI
jgi:uncharacterized membrane protein